MTPMSHAVTMWCFRKMIMRVCKSFSLIGLELNLTKTAIIISKEAAKRYPKLTFRVPQYNNQGKLLEDVEITPLRGDQEEKYLGVLYNAEGDTTPQKAVTLRAMMRVANYLAHRKLSVE